MTTEEGIGLRTLLVISSSPFWRLNEVFRGLNSACRAVQTLHQDCRYGERLPRSAGR